jgi:hypothetical protein
MRSLATSAWSAAFIQCGSTTTVQLRITDGSQEVYEWPAIVGFTTTRLRYPLFGFAGFLQYFNAEFRGDVGEVLVTPNASFPGNVSRMGNAP